MKIRSALITLTILLVAIALFVFISTRWNFTRSNARLQTTNDAYVHADIVPLSTRVTDTLKVLNVGDYQRVHAGEVLAQLDDTDYQAGLDQANAGLEAARAELAENAAAKRVQAAKIVVDESNLAQAETGTSTAEAAVEQAQAAAVQTGQELARQQSLFAQQASTRQGLEKVIAQDDAAKGKLHEAQAAVTKAKAAIEGATNAIAADRQSLLAMDTKDRAIRAEIQARDASVRAAEVQLGYTRIIAPVDGEVGERKVFPGQLVSPGVEVLQLVEGELWIQANFEELQLANMRIGDVADVRVDSIPGAVFHGKISQIAPASGAQSSLLPPDNATGNFTKVVQRVPVKIVLDPEHGYADRLRPGLSAVVEVHTR